VVRSVQQFTYILVYGVSGSQGHKNSEYCILRHANTHLTKNTVFNIFAYLEFYGV